MLGLPLSDATLEAWSRIVCFDLEPLFLHEDLRARFEGRAVLMTRAEFGAWARSMSLEYADAYLPWRVADARAVALLPSVEVAALEPELRAALNEAQVRFKRGLIVELERAREFGIANRFLERDSVQDSFLLRRDAWDALPRNAQFAWLEWFVTQDPPSCLSSSVPGRTRHHIALELTGWLPSSGANCFATVLAYLTADPLQRRTVAGLWLQAATFERTLQARGLREQAFSADLESGAVIGWRDQACNLAHACVYIGDGLVLNKDAQSWYAPRQILALETVLERWREDGLETRVWREV